MKFDFLQRIKLFYYYMLTIGFGIGSLMILVSIKLVGFICFYFVDKWLSPYLNNWSFLPAVIAFWIGASIWYILLTLVFPKPFDKIDVYINRYKEKYSERYGVDFPEPQSRNYGITEDDWIEYRKSFDFEIPKLIVQVLIGIAGFYLINSNIETLKGFVGLFCLFICISLIYSVSYFFNWLDKRNKQKLPQYENIRKFQADLKIYSKIQREKLNID